MVVEGGEDWAVVRGRGRCCMKSCCAGERARGTSSRTVPTSRHKSSHVGRHSDEIISYYLGGAGVSSGSTVGHRHGLLGRLVGARWGRGRRP